MALWIGSVKDLKSQHTQVTSCVEMVSKESDCLTSRKPCNLTELSTVETSSLFCIPEVSVLSDEFSRPAVIGHVGVCNAYFDSPADVREILLSALSTVDRLSVAEKDTPSMLYEPQDSDMEILDNSTDDDFCCDSDDSCGLNVVHSHSNDLKKSTESQHGLNISSTDSHFKDNMPQKRHMNRSMALWSVDSASKSQSTFCGKAVMLVKDALPSAGSSQQNGEYYTNLEKRTFSSLTCTPEKHFKESSRPVAAAFHRFWPIGFSVPFKYSRSAYLKQNILRESSSVRWHTSLEPSCHYENVYIAANTESQNSAESNSTERVKADLHRENAHFIVADMIISAVENIKCNILSQQAENFTENEGGQLFLGFQLDANSDACTAMKEHSDSSASLDSGYESCHALLCNMSGTSDETDFECQCSDDCDKEINMSEGKGVLQKDNATSEDTPELLPRSCSNLDLCSPEVLAQQLFKSFRKQWSSAETESHFCTTLFINKEEFTPNDDMLAIKLTSRMRGTAVWAPPRYIIIFNIHPSMKREAVVAAQNFLCAGCGTEIEPRYIKKLRYCEYLGKYFCDCCHSNEESCIPGQILMKWNFNKFPVCNFSKGLLEEIWQNPLFNVSCINKQIYTKVKDMDKFREVREQVILVKRLLKTCRFAESVLHLFEQVSNHMTEELHLFSVDDLIKVRRGVLTPIFRSLLKSATAHVEGCQSANHASIKAVSSLKIALDVQG
ncbi:protein associated with UVRAG as autophagy enhancer isoform X2 [Protopterus annectens]|uniref:protein associated with UVRAG as autophagy enhancer isoform X2 n=1 Tax=Protopterus annectens TaxID=7888 RepID=UPI001CFAE353|nr:protein associated with UVRAG as autophagy enhancer isoform X2 [Protopterus annectens]